MTQAAVTTTYVYNALGQRVKKANASLTRYFVYDEVGHPLGEYDSSGGLIQETVWLDDIPVATLRPNGAGVSLYYMHTDHLNTPRRISRPADDVIVWRWDSDPFGTTAANEDPDGDSTGFVYNLRFPGQYSDTESGTNYNYFRDYEPYTGRYLQSDPIGLAGGINTYSYAGSNPLIFVDPNGTFLQIVVPVAVVGGAIAVICYTTGACQGISDALGNVYSKRNDKAIPSAAQNADVRQKEYVRAKNFCDTPPPPGSNECSTLSREIDHAKQCIDLYEKWDARWFPGRHAQKISEWRNRLKFLKETHRASCTNKCP